MSFLDKMLLLRQARHVLLLISPAGAGSSNCPGSPFI